MHNRTGDLQIMRELGNPVDTFGKVVVVPMHKDHRLIPVRRQIALQIRPEIRV